MLSPNAHARIHNKISPLLGGHDAGYASVLRSLQTEGILDKVMLLRSYTRMAYEIEALNISTMTIPGLFLETKIMASPLVPTPFYRQQEDTTPSADSAWAGIGVRNDISDTPINGRLIDDAKVGLHVTSTLFCSNKYITFAKPIHKRNSQTASPMHTFLLTTVIFADSPPPCNYHYLNAASCRHGVCPPVRPTDCLSLTDGPQDRCRYGHNYAMTAEHISRLRAELKRFPCSGFFKSASSL